VYATVYIEAADLKKPSRNHMVNGGGESGIRTHGTEGRILSPSGDYLLRNDWLSSLIGALLW
jgi:hypothetical protein